MTTGVRYQGRVQQWQDDRGFGFVAPNGGGDRAFLHINEFARGSRRPVDGDLVTYATATDDRGRLQATQVRLAALRPSARPSDEKPTTATGVMATLGGLHLAGITALCASGRWPWAMAGIALSLSAIAFVAYWWDKRAAQADRWRTPEAHLHLIALLGGWPGAALAQHWLRHKSRKPAFRATFYGTVVLNVVAMVWLLGESKRLGLEAMFGG